MDKSERNPLVSVILPIYNHEQYVVEAIRSVLDQTYRPIELIAIDDGSTDESFARAAAFIDAAAGASGISVSLTRQENRGPAATINACIRKANGKFLSILNSDDLYARTRIERCVGLAESANKPFIISYVEPIDSDGRPLAPEHPWKVWYRTALMHELGVHPTLSVAILYNNLAVSAGNFFFSRSILDKLGDFKDLRYGQDLEYLLNVCKHVEPYLIRDKLYYYRIHGANTITENMEAHDREISGIVRRFLQSLIVDVPDNPLCDPFRTWGGHFNTFPWPPRLKEAFDVLIGPDIPAKPRPARPVPHSRLLRRAPTSLSIVTHELSRSGAPVVVFEVAQAFKEEGGALRVFSPSDGPLRGDFARGGIPVILWDPKVTAHPQVDAGQPPAPRPASPAVAAAARPTAVKKRKKRRAPWKWFLRDRGDRRGKPPRPPAATVPAPPVAPAPPASPAPTLPAAPGPAKVDAAARSPAEPLLINSAVNSRVARWAAESWKGPVFWYVHESVAPEIVVPTPDLVPTLREHAQRGRLRMLFGSDATRRIWAANGFDGEVAYWSGIRSVPENAPPSARNLSPKRRTILNAGSSVGRKGTPTLIEAFAHGRAHGHIPEDVDLCIVGLFPPSQVPLSRDVIQRVAQLDLSANVRLVGIVEPHVLDAYFDEADIYVQASIMECLPIALLTAMSRGLPIVTTNVDGCAEAIIDGESGLTVEPRDIEEMSRAIGALFADPARARQFGEAARRRFNAHFSLEATLPRLAGILFPERAAPGA